MKFELEHRSNLSYEDFAREYLYPHKPVVVTDALRQWRAVERWTPDFFKREFGDTKFTIDEGTRYQGNHKDSPGTVEYTMANFIDQVLRSTDENPAPYFRNRILQEMFPDLQQDIEPLPRYCSPNWLSESYLLKDVQRRFNRASRIELYIGGQGGTFPVLHYDSLTSHAFLMQIYGQKKFILYGPEQSHYMYGKPGTRNQSEVGDIEHPDLERFPLFAKAQPTVFILEPGELVFIPSRWWHTTKMLTSCISISTNVVNQSNWESLTDWICSTRKSLPRVASRVYLNFAGSWRSRRDEKLASPLRSVH